MGESYRVFHLYTVLSFREFSLDDQIKIIFYGHVRMGLSQKQLSNSYMARVDPSILDMIYQIWDEWEEAWNTILYSKQFSYKGFNDNLRMVQTMLA
jgi:hypothetical protein